jgi:hypothetical protein
MERFDAVQMCLVGEGAVRSPAIAEVEPAGRRGSPLGRGAVDDAVCPAPSTVRMKCSAWPVVRGRLGLRGDVLHPK